MSGSTRALEFGHLLKESRRRRKMSQVELGGGRYSGSYISHLESGRRTPTPEVIEFLSRRLGVSPLEWGIREHHDKAATLAAEQQRTSPEAVENLLIAERAWYERDWSAAEQHARRAAAGAKATGAAIRHWESMYVLCQARFAQAEFATAAGIAQELIEHETARRYPVARAQSLSLASIACRASDQLGLAIAHGAAAVEAASGAPPIILAEALMAVVSALSEAGHPPAEMAPYLERLDELAPRLASDHSRGMVAWTIGTAAFKNGDVDLGLAKHDEAKQLLSPQRDLRMWLRFHRSAANCRLDAGITDGVAEMLRMSATGLEIMGNAADVVELRQARARLALIEDRVDEAIGIIESVIKDPVLENPMYGRGTSEFILAEALVRAGHAERAAEHFAAAARIFENEGRLKQSVDAWQKATESGIGEKNLTSA